MLQSNYCAVGYLRGVGWRGHGILLCRTRILTEAQSVKSAERQVNSKESQSSLFILLIHCNPLSASLQLHRTRRALYGIVKQQTKQQKINQIAFQAGFLSTPLSLLSGYLRLKNGVIKPMHLIDNETTQFE